jgi:RNA polymerase sigma factor (sigma-70 family)
MQAHTLLLVAARAGDPQAMQQLLVRLRPDIRRYAAFQCGRASAVEDVVQEALIIVNRRLVGVRDLASFASWLARVVTRLCVLPALRLLRSTESLLRLERDPDFSRRDTPALRLDLAHAFESLSEVHREVILMRDFEQLTIREMAAALSLTPEATKSRLHRARALVREYLLGDAP